MIGVASLNDDEYGMITETSQTYTVELYAEIILVLGSRESVSNAEDRLKYYFQARGVEVVTPDQGESKIYLGDSLCS